MYKIIIPSYKRDDIIFTHTLKCIKESDLKDREIFVFVADAQEFAIYDKKLKPLGITVVQGVRGIPNQNQSVNVKIKRNDSNAYKEKSK